MTVFLPEGIDWLVNIKSEKYRNVITNRFSQEPDALLFYFTGYQNTVEHRIQDPKDKNKLILYNQMPGYEIWFIATKKDNQLIEQIRQTYTLFTQIQFKEMVEIFYNEDIYMNNADNGAYLSLNMAVCYVMQKRQLQLDQQRGLLQSRKTAFEDFKIWSLSAVLGPLFWTRRGDWAINHLVELSVEEYEQDGDLIRFFVKNIGWFRQRLQNQIRQSQLLFNDKNITFEQFLQSNPGERQCKQATFLAYDSLIYPVIENSEEVKSGKLMPITKQQKNRFHDYCKKYTYSINWKQFFEAIVFENIVGIDGTSYRGNEIVNFDKRKNQTFKEILNDFFFQRKANIKYFFIFLTYFSVVSIVQISFLIMMWRIFKERSSLENLNQRTSTETLKNLVTFLTIIFVGTLSFYQYFMIDFFGFRDDPLTIIMTLGFIYYLQNKIQKDVEKNQTLKTLYSLSFLYISFWTTYMTFCLTRSFKVILFYCVAIVGLLGPCLIKLCNRMLISKQIDNQMLRILKRLSDKNLFRIGSIGLVAILYLFPSFRYLAINEHYVISYIPIILSFIVGLCYIILLYECIKTRSKIQILNLLLLGTLSWKLFDLFYQRNRDVDENKRRNAWNMIVISLFTMIHLQIGFSYKRCYDELIYPHQTRLKKIIRNLRKVLIFFSGFTLQVYKGYFSHMKLIPNNLKEWSYQMLCIIIYNFIIAAYIYYNDKMVFQVTEANQPIKQMEDLSIISSETIQK